MGFNTIKLSLGSLAIWFCIVACNNNQSALNQQQKFNQIDSCRLERTIGNMVVAKIGECRNCHLRFDVPRMKENIPILNEIAVLDSLKLSDFIFNKKHNGMYIKSYPDAGKIIDSLDDCERRNLIHFIKSAGRQ